MSLLPLPLVPFRGTIKREFVRSEVQAGEVHLPLGDVGGWVGPVKSLPILRVLGSCFIFFTRPVEQLKTTLQERFISHACITSLHIFGFFFLVGLHARGCNSG